jgi:hypothetical protein
MRLRCEQLVAGARLLMADADAKLTRPITPGTLPSERVPGAHSGQHVLQLPWTASSVIYRTRTRSTQHADRLSVETVPSVDRE